jgi:predicted amidohydrolase
MKLNIAVVQFAITQFEPQHNLKKAERFISEAAAQANIIVFPEDFVTGPLSGHGEYADHDGHYVRHFQQLAARYAIDIVPGSIIESDGERLFNTTYYIDKSGAIKGKYRKVNLWLPERPYLVPGDEHPVFETAYGKTGLLICWDLIFPETFRTMLRKGVELVICPSYWCFEDAGIGLIHDPDSEVTLVNSLCVARAFENEVVVVYANAADAANVEKESLIGRSQVTVPFKGTLHRLNHSKEEMFVQAIDTSLLADAETAYEIRKDVLERPGLLAR